MLLTYLRIFFVALYLGSCVQVPVQAPVPSGPTIKTWLPDMAIVVVPEEPSCFAWAVTEALKTLQPRVQVVQIPGELDGPVAGAIALHWSDPNELQEGTAGVTKMYFDRDTDLQYAAEVYVQMCDVRLIAHELGHAFGLVDKYEPGHLMHEAYPTGGWVITPSERAALNRRRLAQ